MKNKMSVEELIAELEELVDFKLTDREKNVFKYAYDVGRMELNEKK